MQYPYLISRTVDPIFAIFIGVSSFYLHEKRVERPDGHRLNDLIIKKWKESTK